MTHCYPYCDRIEKLTFTLQICQSRQLTNCSFILLFSETILSAKIQLIRNLHTVIPMVPRILLWWLKKKLSIFQVVYDNNVINQKTTLYQIILSLLVSKNTGLENEIWHKAAKSSHHLCSHVQKPWVGQHQCPSVLSLSHLTILNGKAIISKLQKYQKNIYLLQTSPQLYAIIITRLHCGLKKPRQTELSTYHGGTMNWVKPKSLSSPLLGFTHLLILHKRFLQLPLTRTNQSFVEMMLESTTPLSLPLPSPCFLESILYEDVFSHASLIYNRML